MKKNGKKLKEMYGETKEKNESTTEEWKKKLKEMYGETKEKN